MTDAPKRHPFLDDLAEDVVFTTSLLRAPVTGRETVRRVVQAGAAMYASQKPTFLGAVEQHGFFEYEAELTTGGVTRGLVSMLRNDADEVTDLHITFSPLGAVLDLATGLRDALGDEIDGLEFL